MTQTAFIQNFVLRYPRQYVRLISFNHAFSERLLFSCGHLLAWDKHGLSGNSKITMSPELERRFYDRYLRIDPEEKPGFIRPVEIPYEELKITLKQDRRLIGVFNLQDITVDFIRKNKETIIDWSTIATYYKGMDFYFIREFRNIVQLIRGRYTLLL